METTYIILISILLISTIFFYLKFQKVSKNISESKFENENISLLKEIEIIKNKNLEIENNFRVSKEELNIKKEEFRTEIYNLKNDFLIEKEKIYDRGIEKGKELANYRIEIHPYQYVSQNKKLLGSEDVLNVGYKYLMFINDVPTPYSHIEIFETITKKEINEEKINSLLSKITDLTSIIPEGNIKLVGNIAEFGKNLLNFKK